MCYHQIENCYQSFATVASDLVCDATSDENFRKLSRNVDNTIKSIDNTVKIFRNIDNTEKISK
jgi:hypothetical protein